MTDTGATDTIRDIAARALAQITLRDLTAALCTAAISVDPAGILREPKEIAGRAVALADALLARLNEDN